MASGSLQVRAHVRFSTALNSTDVQDAASPPSTSNAGTPKFRPYASPNHHVTKGRYITSNDPRGYIPVYEYPLNGQWIMMDIDDGYILWTGIWKALGNSKADIVKMIDSQPDLAAQIRRVRGGYLKIQGTWMPYEVALRLSRRVAWPIRDDLVPLFGPTFPSTCLSPDQPGYGQVVASAPGRRRTRRSATQAATGGATTAGSAPATQAQQGWTVLTGPGPQERVPAPYQHYSAQYAHYPEHPHTLSSPSTDISGPLTSRERGNSRFTPYPSLTNPSPPLSGAKPPSSHRGSIADVPMSPLSPRPHSRPEIVLPPIDRDPSAASNVGGSSYALPPISALEDLRGIDAHDSAAVLRRLKSPDHPGDQHHLLGMPAISASRSGGHSPGYSSSSWPPAHYHPATAPLPSIHRLPSDPSMRSTQHVLRSYESRDSVRSKLSSVSLHSDSSCAPSPISPPSPSTPATPHSVLSSLAREPFAKDPRQEYHYPPHLQNSSDYRRGSYGSESFSRRSSESEMQLDTSRQPHRPW
ncbi:hypothetical protein PQX77_017831 [Marasmius sp. AFHP31]|nr:hypothetical protein PQX77_017831 [Marasmius sp. AFHP31]